MKLDKEKNYLVFNKILDEETDSSMAYQQADGFWHATTKIDSKQIVDFYSQLKREINYLDTGRFFSIQGLNMTEFKAIGNSDSSWSALNYSRKSIDPSILRQDTQPFTEGQFLSVEDSICRYLVGQQDIEQLGKFYEKYKISVSSEFEKILIELGIKNWIRQGLLGHDVGLPVNSQPFSEKQFFAIYVRSPRNQKAKAVAVEFLYKEGHIYIKDVMRDVKKIEKRFPILRRRKTGPDLLLNDQQYFVDETDKTFISCYTDDFFTPTLIGREDIVENLENGSLEINRRRSNKLLPLVLCYNDDVQQVKNLICLDLKNEIFIQYFVPPAQAPKNLIKNGYRVYHLIGKTYSKESIPTTKLIEHPITALHFSTLTQNVLKISENSQSSLLQKVAKVFIEN